MAILDIITILEEAVDTENIHLVKQALDSLNKLADEINDKDNDWDYTDFE